MSRLKYSFAIIVLVSSTFGMDAQFKADSLRGSLGDIIQFSWLVTHEAQDSLYYTLGELEGSGVEVISQNIVPGKRKSQIQFEAAVYDSVGIYHFPDAVLFNASSRGLDSLFLRGPDLDIYSILSPADTSFRDIKGLHRIRGPIHWLIFVWILVGVLILFGLYKLMGIRKNRVALAETMIPIVAPEEAHLVALRELEHLRREKFLRLHQFKEFHSRLTHILKQYLESRYLIDALELTTSELMLILNDLSELGPDIGLEIQQILDLADLIKFAKAESNELESGEALSQVVEIVNHTKISNDMGDDT